MTRSPWYAPDPDRGITSEFGWRDWDGDGKPDHLHDGWDAAFGPDEPVTIPVAGRRIGSGRTSTAGYWVGYELSPVLRWYAHRLQHRGRDVDSPVARDVVGFTGRRGTQAQRGASWDGGDPKWSKGISHSHQRFEYFDGRSWLKINPRDGRVAAELARIRDASSTIPAGQSGVALIPPILEAFDMPAVLIHRKQGNVTFSVYPHIAIRDHYNAAERQLAAELHGSADKGAVVRSLDEGQFTAALRELGFTSLAQALWKLPSGGQTVYSDWVSKVPWIADGIGGTNWAEKGDARSVRTRQDVAEKALASIARTLASQTSAEIDAAALAPVLVPALLEAVKQVDIATSADLQSLLAAVQAMPAEVLAEFGLQRAAS